MIPGKFTRDSLFFMVFPVKLLMNFASNSLNFSMSSKGNIILTLLLESKWQAYFNQLRKQYFPAHCNYLDAHLTIFHCLPDDEQLIDNTLQQFSQQGHLSLNVKGLKNMGNGVAFNIECPALQQLHKAIQGNLAPWLVHRDRQLFWPHITIQNRVTAFKAARTLAQLQLGFEPFAIKGVGFSIWTYQKGPWQHIKDYSL